jgi:cytochrome c-type biogenesis protein CcmE
MSQRGKFLLGGLVIAGAFAYLIFAGLREATLYFVTPSELLAKGPEAQGKAYRVGGVVVAGSLKKSPEAVELSFKLTDGKATIPVIHKGTPPDLFAEGRGAVVEGTYQKDGTVRSTLIMAKHSEEYRPPKEGEVEAGYKELIKSLRKAAQENNKKK